MRLITLTLSYVKSSNNARRINIIFICPRTFLYLSLTKFVYSICLCNSHSPQSTYVINIKVFNACANCYINSKWIKYILVFLKKRKQCCLCIHILKVRKFNKLYRKRQWSKCQPAR